MAAGLITACTGGRYERVDAFSHIFCSGSAPRFRRSRPASIVTGLSGRSEFKLMGIRETDPLACGAVYSTTWKGDYSDGTYHHHMLHSGVCVNPGDSGSAVYFGGSAFDGKVKGIGIISAGFSECSITSMLDHIYDVMPVRVVTRL